MIMTVASGKGGTGKTTFAVNLAYALAGRGQRVRLLDCDVEEPNDHLFVKPTFTQARDVTVPKPAWDEAKCNGCGECAKACRYNAIAVVKGKALLFPELCHACGVCSYVCPRHALSEAESRIGKVLSAPEHKPFYFARGILNVGESLAPIVVSAVKEHIAPDAVNILDSSPGTACPVVKALSGADLVLIVTEPTVSSVHDMERVLELAAHFRVPALVIINKADLNSDQAARIEEIARSRGARLIGRVPFDRAVHDALIAGKTVVEHGPGPASDAIRAAWREIASAVETER